MIYRRWIHRGGTLIVEQYIGKTSFEDIMSQEETLYEEAEPTKKPNKILTDLSQADLSDLPIEKIEELFAIIDNDPAMKGLQTALYVGSSQLENFQKAHAYSMKSPEHSVSAIPFNFLHTAFEWLGLNLEEQKLISVQLNEPYE